MGEHGWDGKKLAEATKKSLKEIKNGKKMLEAIKEYKALFGGRRRLAHEACRCCPPVVPSALTDSTTEGSNVMTPSERVLHRRRLADGVRTPVVLAALMKDIKDA